MAATLVAAGCTRSSEPVSSPSTKHAVPTGAASVVSWSVLGGSPATGLVALRPPRLAVYPGGEVIADATYRSSLATSDLGKLLDRLSTALAKPDAGKRKSGVAPTAGAPTTALAVRTVAGTYSVSAESLDELRVEKAYLPELYDARDRLADLHERVVSSGQPYTAIRVRLVTARRQVEGTEVRNWPVALVIPASSGDDGIGIVDLTGEAAREVMRLPRDLDLNGAWQAYRAPDGRQFCASWRYLLPDE
jgi:hypothetical protein